MLGALPSARGAPSFYRPNWRTHTEIRLVRPTCSISHTRKMSSGQVAFLALNLALFACVNVHVEVKFYRNVFDMARRGPS